MPSGSAWGVFFSTKNLRDELSAVVYYKVRAQTEKIGRGSSRMLILPVLLLLLLLVSSCGCGGVARVATINSSEALFNITPGPRAWLTGTATLIIKMLAASIFPRSLFFFFFVILQRPKLSKARQFTPPGDVSPPKRYDGAAADVICFKCF